MQASAASSPTGGEANKYAHEIPHSAFIIPNKKKTPSEEKPRKGNAIAHNQHISGEGQRTLTAGPLRNAAGQ